MILDTGKCKRLGIFVFYDPEGVVADYVEYLLQEVKQNVSDLVIVCNGSLSIEGRHKFSCFTEKIIVRPNKGFEATAWKETLINYLGWENVKKFDEVLFLNDICYGPVFSLRQVFEKMDQRTDLDFWGITRHYKAPDFTSKHADSIIPEHIQTYFFVVRKSVINSDNFKYFWENLPEIKSYIDDIGSFETQFTKYLQDCGFKWDTYVDISEYKGEGLSNFCANYDLPYSLMHDKKMPFLRRKSLTQTLPNSVGGPEKEAARALEYIKDCTKYDQQMIWQDLLRKNNILDIYTRQHLNFILPKNSVIYPVKDKPKIALLMHIYYADQIDYCLNFASNMPEYSDLYLTTTKQNETILKKKVSNLMFSKVEVRIVENRGRDMSALFVCCSDILTKGGYDYICCIHDKKSPQVGPLFGRGFRDITFENMLASKQYITNVIGLFERSPFLGYLGFPKMIGGPYWPVFVNSWASPNNFEATKAILKKCNVKVNISETKPPILYANVFWCRPQSLKPLYKLNLKYEDFEPEPLPIDGTFSHALERAVTYIAQDQGFYSGVLFTDEYASLYIPALAEEYRRMSFAYDSLQKELEIEKTKYNPVPIVSKIKERLISHPLLYRMAKKFWYSLNGL